MGSTLLILVSLFWVYVLQGAFTLLRGCLKYCFYLFDCLKTIQLTKSQISKVISKFPDF